MWAEKRGVYSVIFDDDNSGEIADIVAIREEEEEIEFEFFIVNMRMVMMQERDCLIYMKYADKLRSQFYGNKMRLKSSKEWFIEKILGWKRTDK